MKPGKGEQPIAQFTCQNDTGLDILVGAHGCHDGKDSGNDGDRRGSEGDSQPEKTGQQGKDEKELSGKEGKQRRKGDLHHKGNDSGAKGQAAKLGIHKVGKIALLFKEKEYQRQNPRNVFGVGNKHQKSGNQVKHHDHGVDRLSVGGVGPEAFFVFDHMTQNTDARKCRAVDGVSGRNAPKTGADTIIAAG